MTCRTGGSSGASARRDPPRLRSSLRRPGTGAGGSQRLARCCRPLCDGVAVAGLAVAAELRARDDHGAAGEGLKTFRLNAHAAVAVARHGLALKKPAGHDELAGGDAVRGLAGGDTPGRRAVAEATTPCCTALLVAAGGAVQGQGQSCEASG